MKTYLWYQVCYIKFLKWQEVPISLIAWTFFAQHNQNYGGILFYFILFMWVSFSRLEHNQFLCAYEAGGYEDLVFDAAVWGGPQRTPYHLHKASWRYSWSITLRNKALGYKILYTRCKYNSDFSRNLTTSSSFSAYLCMGLPFLLKSESLLCPKTVSIMS